MLYYPLDCTTDRRVEVTSTGVPISDSLEGDVLGAISAQAIEADAAGFTLDLGWFRQHADPKILISINRMIMDPTATNESASQCMRRRDIWNDVALWGIDEDDEFGECSSDEGDSDIPRL